MTKMAGPKKVKKLSVKRTTVKDLSVASRRGDAVRGGATVSCSGLSVGGFGSLSGAPTRTQTLSG